MKTYNLSEAKARFSAVVEEAAAGEEIIVTKMNKPVVRVVPYLPLQAGSRMDSMRGEIEIASDFDEWSEEEARSFGMID